MSGPIQLVNLLLSLLAFALVARWYIIPRLREVAPAQAIQPFLLLHSFRHIGMMFLAEGAVKTDLPEGFSLYAAYGDLAASILAFVALAALRLKWPFAMLLVWVFNIEGTIDLVTAVSLGVANDAATGMGATFWIPSVIVPALLVTHYIVFVLLLRSRREDVVRGA
ncbi:MAG: hypothetical protein ACE1ZW_07400 [Nitrospirales bacterium]